MHQRNSYLEYGRSCKGYSYSCVGVTRSGINIAYNTRDKITSQTQMLTKYT